MREYAENKQENSDDRVFGLEFKDSFSPAEPLDGMEERMKERVKKVRKLKKNNIFNNPFKIKKD